MARSPSQKQVYDDLATRYGRAIADAFFQALDDLRSRAEVERIMAAYARGDIEAALDALHLDPAAFNAMQDRIREAHSEGGRVAAEMMPKRRPDGTALVIRFDGRNPEAERWLAEHSADLVTRITQEQRGVVRTSLTAAMERGENPRTAALDIVGRINRASGKREGGVLGLTAPQEAYVASARGELANDDPAALRNYLERGRRDRRFDRSVTKAIREGKPVPAEIAAKAVTAYERRLLQLRGETVGRVEAMTSLQQAKYEAYRQGIEGGQFGAAAVRKVWRSAGDIRVRHTHRQLDGESVGFSEAFVSPSGARLRFPMDASLGAGADEIINCRCDATYRVDWLANAE